MIKNLNPYVYYLGFSYVMNRVLFVDRSGDLPVLARLNPTDMDASENQVLQGRKVSLTDPIPADLSMSSMNLADNAMDVRTLFR